MGFEQMGCATWERNYLKYHENQGAKSHCLQGMVRRSVDFQDC